MKTLENFVCVQLAGGLSRKPRITVMLRILRNWLMLVRMEHSVSEAVGQGNQEMVSLSLFLFSSSVI
jgi:hypothetical protein